MSSPVVFADQEDPTMRDAMARARATFKYLWRELTWEYRRIVPGLQMSAVKAAFADPGGADEDTEHMWLSEVTFNGDTITAVLLNAPNNLQSVREGDRVVLTLEQLEDWMYVMDQRVYGGFTIQAMRATMSAAERKSHDAAWGLDFPDPGSVELVPNWEAGNKPGLLGRLFGGKQAPPPGDPDREHPMSENMAPELAKALAQDPTGFFEGDEDGLNTLHSLALGGSAAGVRVLLEHGADPSAKTHGGKTARELAQQLGWSRVVELLAAAERAN